ncbi:MAG TPA: universal stress protein [Bacillota bacterium]|nr:universal stress protein [Bacillota bacterium]
MTVFENMLVAFDGSEDGMKAIEVAEELANVHGARLTVLYVHDEPLEHTVSISKSAKGESYLLKSRDLLTPGATTSNIPPVPELEENIVVEDEIPIHVMNQAKGKLESTDLEVTYKTLSGKPVTEITNYAKENGIDMIIIGNRGISGIKKFVQGSVSQKVTNDAECAVFVVK